MNLNNTLNNLRKTKYSFFNLGKECVVDYVLFKKHLKIKIHINHSSTYSYVSNTYILILKDNIVSLTEYNHDVRTHLNIQSFLVKNIFYTYFQYSKNNFYIHIPYSITNYFGKFNNRNYLLKLVE